MSTRKVSGPSLFDVLDRVEAKEQVQETGECLHKFERKDEKSWPGHPKDPRMIFICETCGKWRGRIK